jgi:hypothetical protein
MAANDLKTPSTRLRAFVSASFCHRFYPLSAFHWRLAPKPLKLSNTVMVMPF